MMKKIHRMARYWMYGAKGDLSGSVFGSIPCFERARRKQMCVVSIVSQPMKVAIET